jgi:hypothetical protein
MTTHVQVSGSNLKARLEKAFTTKEIHPAIDLLEELLRGGLLNR